MSLTFRNDFDRVYNKEREERERAANILHTRTHIRVTRVARYSPKLTETLFAIQIENFFTDELAGFSYGIVHRLHSLPHLPFPRQLRPLSFLRDPTPRAMRNELRKSTQPWGSNRSYLADSK